MISTLGVAGSSPAGRTNILFPAPAIQKILALPPETRIFVGHDYLPAGRSDYACETSVAAQKAGNIHVHDGVSADDFIAMRRARDVTLAPPLRRAVVSCACHCRLFDQDQSRLSAVRPS